MRCSAPGWPWPAVSASLRFCDASSTSCTALNAPPKRLLGLGSATALVIASMIGTGVFTTSGFLLGELRSRWAVLAVWAAGGVIALLGALSYGALARRVPESGGEYLYLSRTLHPAAGYIAGWISLLVGFSAPLAAAAVGFGEYTEAWFSKYTEGWLEESLPRVAGTLLVLLFAGIHATHVRQGAWVQNFVVLVKLALIALVLSWGGIKVTPADAADFFSAPLSGFGLALVLVSFSYSGWNAAVYMGGEVQDPERNLPRSLLLGTLIVSVIYVALNAVFLFAVPTEQLANQLEVGRIAAYALGGKAWAELVTGLVALALVTSVSSLVMAGPRVYARMAADGSLPRWLAAGEGPPRAAIALQVVLAVAMIWTATYKSLLIYIGFTLSLSTAATVVGLMVLRRREGPQLAVIGWPWVPASFVLAVLGMAALTLLRTPVASLAGLATIGVGLLAWALKEKWRWMR